jgi:hypothetical protein
MSYAGKIETGARRMAASAVRSSTVKINGTVYTLTFDPERWVYNVTDAAGGHVVTFNTKKVTVAKTWLREHIGDGTS